MGLVGYKGVDMSNWRSLYAKFVSQLNPKIGAEVGVWEGANSIELLKKLITLEKLYCIDTWKHYPPRIFFKPFIIFWCIHIFFKFLTFFNINRMLTIRIVNNYLINSKTFSFFFTIYCITTPTFISIS